ncbi:hypothetical protein DN069_02375 [Streptacidiphilus pinicola]|uniref:Novel STAND NTPase 3 domain-containing protein n=1 Tax=Streptacidiphilus pinicola TaxID=2219663 RepID=A0A2X0IVC6_9ACTN|nr:hypothetical protein [Streptacidiphilus pinicola]RAG87381.1 hypothetical protein DN069_02375 [Streptacidiphilus pinicola]
MSDVHRVDISDTHGLIHNGPGHQFFLNFAEQEARDGQSRPPRKVAEDDLSWLRQRFVPPGHLGKAREVLTAEHVVIVRGPEGSGRTSAARMLLHEVRAEVGTFYELAAEDDETEQAQLLASVEVDSKDRLLLDFTSAGERFWPAIQPQLAEFREIIRSHQAHLVIVLPSTVTGPLPDGLGRFEAEIEAPLRSLVLLKHLRAEGLIPEGATPPVLRAFLDRMRPMREVADLAALIAKARDSESVDGTFETWCAAAVAAAGDRAKEVADFVARLQDGPQRALLLAVAMLHEAHSDAVHRGAAALLTALRHPPEERPVLERRDLYQRLLEVGAHTSRDGWVRFDDLGFDQAVRRHFWSYLPEARDGLFAWVRDGIKAPELSDADRSEIVARFSEQCLSTGDQKRLCDLVTAWADSSDIPRIHAARALQHGLDNEQHSGFFRRRIYLWSLERQEPGLTDVLVNVCTDVLAIRYPDQALVRLHHLARRQERHVSARSALLRLATDDRRLYRLLMSRLGAAPIGAWPEDTALFLILADPHTLTSSESGSRPLLAESGLRKDLALGWHRAFLTGEYPAWNAVVTQWFDVAAENEAFLDPITDTLVAGCDGRVEQLGRLYTAGRDWARGADPTARLTVTAALRQKIDAAQGYSAA